MKKYPHVCQDFQRGGCPNTACTLLHQWTFTNDLDLEYTDDIAGMLPPNIQRKIVDICLLDVNEINEHYVALLF